MSFTDQAQQEADQAQQADRVAAAYDRLQAGGNDPADRQTLQDTLAGLQNNRTAPAKGADVGQWAVSDDSQQRTDAQTAIENVLIPRKDGVERITDWGAIEAPEREYLIDKWLPRGRIGMFSGRGGSGKTLLLIQMAATMAAGGGLWLGRAGANDPRMPVAAPGVAVFASWEDEGTEFKRRLGWMDAEERKTYHRDDYESLISRIGDRFRFLDLSRRGPVWGVEKSGLYNQRASLLAAGKIVRAECEQTGASLLILDSLGYAYGADDNANEGVADFMADWDSWGRDHGCTVVLVHHPPKEQGGKGTSSGYRGASSWEMHSRWRWELGSKDMEGGTLDRLICAKASYSLRPDPVWLDRDDNTGWVWRERADQNPRPKQNNGAGQDQTKGEQANRGAAYDNAV